ncbi:MAG: hypothetical protein ABR923_04320 [Terracidiphilus sp.]|jgi:hypothetical protein
MNADLAQEMLNELGSSLENLETQQAALLQFLKDNGKVTDDQLAPYLAQAGKASSVRWRAAHIRLDRLISTEKQKEEQLAEKEQHKAGAAKAPSQDQAKDTKTEPPPAPDPGKEAKSKDDEAKGEAAPQHEAAATNAGAESAGAQPVSEKKSGHDEQAASEDQKASPKPEKNGA